MKYLVKIILPPLFAFFAFAVFIKFTPDLHKVNGLENLGEYTVPGLIAYYKIFAPAQIVIALLTQWLIAMPLWKKILEKPKAAVLIFSLMLLVCAVCAFGLAYIIWDPATSVGYLVQIGLFMTGVQVFYWVLNFLVLYLLDLKSFKKAQPEAETEE